MKVKVTVLGYVAFLIIVGSNVQAQTFTTTVSLGPNQIGLIKTAPGITTRVAFQEQVKEIICGDLYDPNSGKGNFVVQQSGNDVFLKPIGTKGISNLFVKTGHGEERIYSFDLLIVPVPQAFRIVNVTYVAPGRPLSASQQADEILRNARQKASQIIAEAMQWASDKKQRGAQEAEQDVARNFARAILEAREARLPKPRVVAKRSSLVLDERLLIYKGKIYLRYSLQNEGDDDLTFSTISLESGQGKETKIIPVEVAQSKGENKLSPGETITGIIVFDQRVLEAKDQLTLYVRTQQDGEIAHASIAH